MTSATSAAVLASLGALLVTASCATVSPAQQELIARLNRGRRDRSSRVEFVESIPFGESLRIERYALGNGLRILLVEDHSAPVVSYQTWYRVGSRHEHEGKTGLAHLFEHLMFNETENLAAGEFDRRMESAGGETNAATWVDWTYYYENVPARELGLVAQLEADRMQNLVLRDPQVASEKEVVANERRYRVDDDVEGAANELLYATAFRTHPYHWPTIGWMQDIQNFTTRDCLAFYKTFYAPNNATVILVGDINVEQTLALLQTHYGPIRSSRLPEEERVREPAQRAERRVTIARPTPTDKISIGYRAPAFGEEDHIVLTVLNEILFGGRSARVYRALITDTEIASDVRGSASPFRDAGLYEIWASAREGHDAEDMLTALDRELTRIKNARVSVAELEKAKNRLELGFWEGMESASGKAEQIGFYETVLGDPGAIFGRIDQVRAVTAADIQRVAREVFEDRRRTIVFIQPSGEVADEGDDDAEE